VLDHWRDYCDRGSNAQFDSERSKMQDYLDSFRQGEVVAQAFAGTPLDQHDVLAEVVLSSIASPAIASPKPSALACVTEGARTSTIHDRSADGFRCDSNYEAGSCTWEAVCGRQHRSAYMWTDSLGIEFQCSGIFNRMERTEEKLKDLGFLHYSNGMLICNSNGEQPWTLKLRWGWED
jgi:hypothetical protein